MKVENSKVIIYLVNQILCFLRHKNLIRVDINRMSIVKETEGMENNIE